MRFTTILYNKQRIFFYTLLICCISDIGFAQTVQKPVIVQQTQKVQLIGNQIFYLEDTEGKLKLEDILASNNQQKFQPHTQLIFNRPPTNNVFWFKFQIQNKSNDDLWLTIGSSYSWYLDFYAPNASGKYQAPILLGAFRPQTNKAFAVDQYCVQLAHKTDTQVKTYYLRVEGKFPNTYIFQVGNTRNLTTHFTNISYANAIFIGLVIAMMIYNLFLLYVIKDRLYLIYFAYLASLLFTVPFVNGAPFLYKIWIWKYFIAWQSIMYFFMALFAINYLDLPKNAPKLNRWLQILTIIIVGVFPVLNLLQVDLAQLQPPFQLVLLIFYFSLLICGIYIQRKGYKKARFYIWAWSFAIAAAFAFIFTINGLLPLNIFTQNSLYIGFGLETLMFALALGDRFNTLKEEKEKAQAQNLSLIREQNTVLEQKVQEKTKSLQEAHDELQVNNEELQQTQEEIEAQRDTLEIQNTRLLRYQKRIDNSFKVAQLIQMAVLPYQRKMDELLKDYFVIYKPKDIVSGDFYWLNKIDNQVFLVVIDCTGHGVPGAFVALICNTLFDKIIRIWKLKDPAQILARANEEINIVLRQEVSGYRLGMDVALCRLDTAENQATQVHFSGAKRPLYYIKKGQDKLEEIRGTRLSIGTSPDTVQTFTTQSILLEKGSIIYLGTDGYADQNNKQRKAFTSRRLKQELVAMHHHPLPQQKLMLDKMLTQYMDKTDQRDDILLIGKKI